jgi:DNA invertase Pin-like site-specific DNA recombinase
MIDAIGSSGFLDTTEVSRQADSVDASEDLWNRWRRLIRQASPDPLEVATMAATFERYFDAVKTEAVKAARRAGHSWEEIASTLGTSRQSAWERYRRAENLQKSRWWPVPMASDAVPK